MAVIVSPLAGTTLNTASSFLKAEVYNLGMFSTTDSAALTTPLDIAVTFPTAARKNAGVILSLESSATTIDRSLRVSLQQIKGTCTFDTTTEEVIFNAHGLADGTPVTFGSTSTLPTFTPASDYGATVGYVSFTFFARSTDTSDATNRFFLYTSAAYAIAGGATGKVALSGTPAGTCTLYVDRGAVNQTSSELYNGTTQKYGSNIIPCAWTGYTIDDTASKWRFHIFQYGGTTGTFTLRTSTGATLPFYCEISDIAATATDNDTMICYGPVTIDTAFTAKGQATGSAMQIGGDGTYNPAIIVCKSPTSITPTSCNENLRWVKVPSAGITLTVNNVMVLGFHSGFRVGREDVTVTTSIADPCVVAYTGHGLTIGDPVRLKTTGALPTGITAGTIYYIRSDDCVTPANEFHLYDTYAHAVDTGATTGRVATSGTQSGAHRVQWRIPLAQMATLSFIAATVGTASGIYSPEPTANVLNACKSSLFIFGERSVSPRANIPGAILNGATSFVTTETTGWANGDKIAIGKRTQQGGDSTVYTVDSTSGTTVNLTGTVTGARSAGGWSIRLNGYGVKIVGPTTSSLMQFSVVFASNFTLDGCEISYHAQSFWYGKTAFGLCGDDTANVSTHLITYCSAYTNTTNAHFVSTLSVVEQGVTLSYLDLHFVGLNITTRRSTASVGVFTVDHTWNMNLGSQSAWETCDKAVITNNIVSNAGYFVTMTGVGITVQNNYFWGCSQNTAGQCSLVLLINPIWSGNTFENCIKVMNVGSTVIATFTNDVYGAVVANTKDIDFTQGAYCNLTMVSPTTNFVIDSTNQKLLSSGSYVRFKQYNDTDSDYRAYYPEGRFYNPSQGETIKQISNAGTTNLINSYYVSTGAISGFKCGLAITGDIDNAAYYATDFTLPNILVTYDLTSTVDDDMTASTDAQSFLLIFSPTTGYNDIKLSLTTSTDAAGANAGVTWSACSLKIRKYGYVFGTYSIAINQTTESYLNAINTPAANTFVTEAVKATVDAYTGITINHSTQTLTISDNHTLAEVYDFIQSDLTADANMGYAEWFTTIDGVTYTSTYDIVVDGAVFTATGLIIDCGAKDFTLENGGSVIALRVTDAGGTAVTVTLDGTLNGAIYEVYETGDGTVIESGTATGDVGISYNHTGDVAVTCRIRQFGYLEWVGTGTITTSGLTFNIAQVADPNTGSYTAGIADDFTIDTDAFTITHTAGTTVYTAKELYNWTMDYFADLTPDMMQLLLPMSAQTPFDFSVINSYTIPDASHAYIKSGSLTEDAGDTLWANVYTVGTIASGNLYIYQDSAEYTKYWGTGNIDVLLKVKASGALIDSGNVTIFTREYGYLYDHYLVNLANGGRTAVSVSNPADGNNATAHATIEAWGITIATEDAPYSKDIDDGEGACEYSAVVDGDGHSIQDIYEWLKFTAEEGQAGEAYTRANAAYSEVKTAPYGTFAGGIFFGARGIWVEDVAVADALNYVLIDNAGATHQVPSPPVQMTVKNIVAGSRLQLYNIDTDTEIFNDIVAGTSHSEEYSWSEDQDIRIRLAHVDGKTAYAWYETQGTASSTGMSVRASQALDAVYNSLAIDGSSVSECSITGDVLTVEIDDGDNATTWGRIYAFCSYWLFTEDGMRDQELCMIATDIVHFTFYGGLQIKNMDMVNPLVITGGFAVDDEGSAVDLLDLTGGMIFTASTEVVPFTYSTGSGLSTEEHDAIMEIKEDVDAMDTSKLLTTGKFLALK